MVGRVSSSIQRVLVWGGVGPENDDGVLVPLFTFLNEFPSNSFGIHASSDMPMEISDIGSWKVTWSSVVNINGASCMKEVES